MKKERNSDFELLRIVSMCGIIAIHYLAGHLGGMAENAAFPNFAWFLSRFVNSIASPLVNCFVLISGYYLINKDSFCIRKAIVLLIITTFYGVLGYSIGIIFDVTTFSARGLLNAIIPFFDAKRWFVETYIILILLAPFINKVLSGLDKRSFQILLIVQLSIFSVWYSVGLSAPLLDDGYGIINFITLYMLGAYYKFFGTNTRLLKLSKRKLITGYIGCSFLTFIFSYFINPFGYAFVTNIMGSLFVFGFFEKLSVGYNKKINTVSAAAFDVYFVHSDEYTSRLLIYELMQGKLFVGSVLMVPHLVLVILAMYLLGMIAFKVRIYLFSISINKLLDRIPLINVTRTI